MDDLISRQDTIDRINEYIEEYSEIDSDGNHSEKWCAMQEARMTIENMPPAQPDTRLEKIADLVDGSIDHFDLEDAMDLLYQIKDALRGFLQ